MGLSLTPIHPDESFAANLCEIHQDLIFQIQEVLQASQWFADALKCNIVSHARFGIQMYLLRDDNRGRGHRFIEHIFLIGRRGLRCHASHLYTNLDR